MSNRRIQDEINQAEWENNHNWSSIYFSKRDSRTYVPKRNPRHGWTINFGSPNGARWIYYLFTIFLLIGFFLGAVLTLIVMGVN